MNELPHPPGTSIALETLQALGLAGKVQQELQRQRWLAAVPGAQEPVAESELNLQVQTYLLDLGLEDQASVKQWMEQEAQGEGQALSFVAGAVDQSSPLLQPVSELLQHHGPLQARLVRELLVHQDQVVAGHEGAVDALGLNECAVQLRLQLSIEEQLQHRLHLQGRCVTKGLHQSRLQPPRL